MNYCILSPENIIANIIVCADDETAASFGAVPSYDGAKIGGTYTPPEPEPEPTETEVLQAQVAELQAELLRLRTGG